MLLIDANRPEAAGLAEREARLVEGKNAGEDFPETTFLCLTEQCFEQRLADATSADVTVQIDREVGDADVARTRAVAAQVCPRHYRAVDLNDQHRMARHVGHPGLHIHRGARLGLERRAAVFDPLVVDLGNGLNITELSEADVHLASFSIGTNNELDGGISWSRSP
ncbi:hypothetical protein O165_023320 [Pseudomonas soli]|nr:hypothetical protein O165_023320 [Pseudomonas soli]